MQQFLHLCTQGQLCGPRRHAQPCSSAAGLAALGPFAELNLEVWVPRPETISEKPFHIPRPAVCLFRAEAPGTGDSFSK